MNNDEVRYCKPETLRSRAAERLCAQEMDKKEKTTQPWSMEQKDPSLGPFGKVLPKPVLRPSGNYSSL